MSRSMKLGPIVATASERITPTRGSGIRASDPLTPIPSSANDPEVTQPSVDHASVMRAAALPEPNGAALPPLVERACAGDPQAMEMLVRQELPRVEGLLRRLLGPRSDMEDLVQTVFLEFCRALPGFRGDSTVSTFVGGISVRVARRAMRPAAWFRLRGPMPEDPPQSSDRPHENAVAAEQLRRAEAGLAKLTPEKRVAFVLWALEGHDVDAVAQLMGATVAATRSRIYYAQKELKVLAAHDPYLSALLEGSDAG